MPHTTQRTHRAFKVAYWPDVQRIFYTATLTAFIHGWALHVLACLVPSALTVLQFLAALHRSNKNGYIGTAVAYELLAKQIAKATGRPCSVRTLQRGIAALKLLGFISLRYWTLPDQTIHFPNGHTVKLKGTGRKPIGGGEWRSLQIRVITLTETAIAMWDKSTKSAGSRYVGKLPTPAKSADSSLSDQVENSTMVKVSTTEQQTSTDPRQMKFDNAPSVRLDKKGSADEIEGRPTCPPSGQAPTATIEHGASKSPQLPASPCTTEPTEGEALKKAPVLGEVQTKTVPKGCSQPRPTLPKRPPNKAAWHVGRLFILSELHKALEPFSQRQADAIFSRARFELSRNYPGGWPTSVNWDYWVPRFADFPPSQRKSSMLSQILPLLKSPAAITPNEPKRRGRDFQGKLPKESPTAAKLPINEFLSGLNPPKYDKKGNRLEKDGVTVRKPDDPKHISTTLNPFLARFSKFCGDDPTD